MKITLEVGAASIDHVLRTLRDGGIHADAVRESFKPDGTIQSPPKGQERTRTTIEFGVYDPKQMGRPWIGRVGSWPDGGAPKLSLGRWYGSDGEAGNCEILARSGDIVAWGQKDLRNWHNTKSHHGYVDESGAVQRCGLAEARERWLANHATK